MWARLDGRPNTFREGERWSKGAGDRARPDGRRERAGWPPPRDLATFREEGGIHTHRSRDRLSRPDRRSRSASRASEGRPIEPPRSTIGVEGAPPDDLPRPRTGGRTGTVERSGSDSRGGRRSGPRPQALPASRREAALPGRVAAGPSIRRASCPAGRQTTVNTSSPNRRPVPESGGTAVLNS